jgi:hypothetical protein
VNDTVELLCNELTVTLTPPLAAPVGTCATTWESLQLTIEVAAVPAKLTKLLPWVAPNPEPVTVICAPNFPALGDTAVTTLLGTVYVTELL